MSVASVKTVSTAHREISSEALDLSAVSSDKRIMVGSFPRDEESAFRLLSWLEHNHGRCFKIVNCLSEPEQRVMRSAELLSAACGLVDPNSVESFSMAPNTPGALKQMLRFCISHDTFFAKQESNVLVVLCKTGRGRSGMLAACLLLHLSKMGHAMTADEAVAAVCEARGEGSVSYPSQIRYVHYYERLLRSQKGEYVQTLRLNAIRMTTCPSFDPSILNQGCSPYAVVSILAQMAEPAALESHMPFHNHIAFHQQERLAKEKKSVRFYSKTKGEDDIEIDLRDSSVTVRGDTIVSLHSGEHKMLQVCFNTAFVEENYLIFDKSSLDLAHLDVRHRRFDADFRLELFFSRVSDQPELNIDTLSPTADQHDPEQSELQIANPE